MVMLLDVAPSPETFLREKSSGCRQRLEMAVAQWMLMRGRKGRQQDLPWTVRTGPKQANAVGSMCESPLSHQQMLMVRVMMLVGTSPGDG